MTNEKRKMQVLDFDEKYQEEERESNGFSSHFKCKTEDEGQFSILDTPLALSSESFKSDPVPSLHEEKRFIPLEDVVVRNNLFGFVFSPTPLLYVSGQHLGMTRCMLRREIDIILPNRLFPFFEKFSLSGLSG